MPGTSALQKRTAVKRPDDSRYLTQTAGDARYQTGSLSPLYGYIAKLAQTSTARCNILMIGDSIMEGQGSSVVTNRWVDRAQTQMRAKWATGTQGAGWQPVQYAATASGGGVFPGWTESGTASSNIPQGIGYKGRKLASGTTFTKTVTCTSFELHFWRQANDVMSITIDGGTATTFTLSTSVVYQKWTSPALTPGSHTITVSGASAGGCFLGGMFYNGDETAGLALLDASHSGALALTFATTYPGWFDHVPLFSPTLAVLGCATNDCRTSSGGYSAVNYQTYMQSIITQLRSRTGQGSLPVLLMPPYQPLGTLIEPWSNYIAALNNLVAANSYTSLFDMSARVPSLASDPYGYLFDTVHPSNLGAASMSALATTALSPN